MRMRRMRRMRRPLDRHTVNYIFSNRIIFSAAAVLTWVDWKCRLTRIGVIIMMAAQKKRVSPSINYYICGRLWYVAPYLLEILHSKSEWNESRTTQKPRYEITDGSLCARQTVKPTRQKRGKSGPSIRTNLKMAKINLPNKNAITNYLVIKKL